MTWDSYQCLTYVKKMLKKIFFCENFELIPSFGVKILMNVTFTCINTGPIT